MENTSGKLLADAILKHRTSAEKIAAGAEGVTRSWITKLTGGGVKRPPSETLIKVADFLGVGVETLMGDDCSDKLKKEYMTLQGRSKIDPSLSIPEYDVRAGAGGGGISIGEFSYEENQGYTGVPAVIGEWNFPSVFLRQELKSTGKKSSVWEVVGDSMYPTLSPGDRVIVDEEYKYPSPDGVYLLNDGNGIVVKRLEIVRSKGELVVNVISDNQKHTSRELHFGEGHDASVIGRVVGKISRM